MSMTVLVTGGAGFIGSHLVEALVGRGDRVRVLDDFSTGRLENLSSVRDAVEVIVGDVREHQQVERAMRGVEAVLHVAAIPSVALSFQQPELVDAVNVGGTAVVTETAHKLGVGRIVLASSCAVYGDAAPPLTEDTAPAPLSPYAAGKLMAEERLWLLPHEAVGVGRPTAVALRYFNVYGPRQDPSSAYSGVIARFMYAVCRGEACTVHGDGQQSRDFVFVADVVAANLLALESPSAAWRSINVGSGAETTVLQLIAGIESAASQRARIEHSPARRGDVRSSCASITLAADLLGYRPAVDLKDGLAATYAWYAGRGSG